MNDPNDPGNPYRQPPAEIVHSASDFEAPQSRGCLFYGCIIAVVLFVLGVILAAIAGFIAYNFYSGLIRDYTSPTPVAIPKVDFSDDNRKALDDRVKAFKESLDAGKAEELVLTADELNALIAENEHAKDKVFVTLKGESISGKISYPLDGIPLANGRYLNGSATLKVYLRDGRLNVIAEDFEVNGKKMPPAVKARLSGTNFAEDFNRDPKNAEMFRKFDSIEVKDSKLYIKSRARTESSTKDDEAKPKEDEAKPKEDEAKPKEDEGKPKEDEAKPKETPAESEKAEAPAPKAAA